MIENTDQRSKDYSNIAQAFRPGHADITYHQKYGIRDYRGGGRSSAREDGEPGGGGGVAWAVPAMLLPGLRITGYMVQMGSKTIDRARGLIWLKSQQSLLVPRSADGGGVGQLSGRAAAGS